MHTPPWPVTTRGRQLIGAAFVVEVEPIGIGVERSETLSERQRANYRRPPGCKPGVLNRESRQIAGVIATDRDNLQIEETYETAECRFEPTVEPTVTTDVTRETVLERLRRDRPASRGLGTPGTGSQAFPTLPCSLESGEIRLNPPGCFPCLSLLFPTVIQSTSKVGETSQVSLWFPAVGQSTGKVRKSIQTTS